MGSFVKGLYKGEVTGSHSDSGFSWSGLVVPANKYTCPSNKWAIAVITASSLVYPGAQAATAMSIYNNNLPHLKVAYNANPGGAGTVNTAVQVPGEVFLRPGDSLMSLFENSNLSGVSSGSLSYMIFEYALGTI